LRIAFDRAGDDDNLRGQIVILEQAFRAPASDAVKRELNLLRRNAVTGSALVSNLTRVYHEHNLRRQLDRDPADATEEVVPRIICSEGLV